MDRCSQCIDAVEFLLVAQFVPEYHFDIGAVDVPVEVEQVHFQHRFRQLFLERRPDPYVSYAFVRRPVDFGFTGKDTGNRRDVTMQLHIDRGHIEGAPNLTTVNHLAGDKVGVPKQLLRQRKISCLQAFADACA